MQTELKQDKQILVYQNIQQRNFKRETKAFIENPRMEIRRKQAFAEASF